MCHSFLLAGLGNEGNTYTHTRHNIGFWIIDAFGEQYNALWQKERFAHIAVCRIKNKSITLIKPTTLMNLSGKAVHYWLQQKKLAHTHLLVLVDDLHLPLGKLRLRTKGGSGGHNGLAHIALSIGTENYPRLRIGIGNDYHKGEQSDFVLGKWTDTEHKILSDKMPAYIHLLTQYFLHPASAIQTINSSSI